MVLHWALQGPLKGPCDFLDSARLGLPFLKGESYLVVPPKITHYLAEQFRQIAHYLVEHLIQKKDILFNENFECKYASMQVCNYANIQVCKLCKDVSIQVCKFIIIQVSKYTSMQIYNYTS